MKTHLWLIVCCLVLGVHPLVGHTDPDAELIEQLPTGCINWTHGVVTAKGVATPQPAKNHGFDAKFSEYANERARQQAVQNVLQTVIRVRMDDRSRISDCINAKDSIRTEVEEMAASAKILQTVNLPNGGVEVTVQMDLYGGFAQLLLPAAIRQVEPIKPLNATVDVSEPETTAAQNDDAIESEVYSGLVVDARGIGAQPSLVPVLMDESGNEVYSPAFVSREFAVQKGVCQYIRKIDAASPLPRIAPKPLLVKGLRTISDGSCDIVISNADASKLHGTSSHLGFLKQCRVVIIMDKVN